MSDDSRIFTAAIWTVRPGNEEIFRKAWEEFAVWTSKHVEGTLDVKFLQTVDDPRKFVSIGGWKDMKSVGSWRARPEWGQFFEKAKVLCEEIKPLTLKEVFSG